MYYSDELIEEIRLHNDILDVVSSYVPLKKKGNSHFGLCPFHNEKSPSFAVTPDKQMYYCFGCGAGGNVYTFIMEYENFSFLEAVKHLADRAHITLPSPEVSEEVKKQFDEKQQLLEINKEAAKYFYYQLKTEKGKKAYDYLINREISGEILKKFGLGYSNVYRDDLYLYLKKLGYKDQQLLQTGLMLEDKESVHDRFWNRVMFPIFDVHNRVIGFGGRVLGEGMPKYINSPETKLFDKSKNLYGLNLARVARKQNILIVEGYMDVISLHQAGFTQAVASLGTAFTTGQARLLKRYTEEVIIAYDSDEAGVKATLRAIPILKDVGLTVKVLNMKPYKDPDDFIKALGAEAFEKCIDSAKNSFIFEIEVLEKGYNLTDPDEKTKFMQKIAHKILELESDIEKDNYMEAIAKKYQVKQQHLEQLVHQLGARVGIVDKKVPVRDNRAKENKEDGIQQAQRLLLAYLMKDINIYKKVKEYVQPVDFKDPIYSKVAENIYDLYNQGSEIQAAKIINQFITVEEQKLVADLLNRPLSNTSKQELEKLINETVYKLKKYSLDYASRNAKDVTELQRVISEQSKLQKLHISLNDG